MDWKSHGPIVTAVALLVVSLATCGGGDDSPYRAHPPGYGHDHLPGGDDDRPGRAGAVPELR